MKFSKPALTIPNLILYLKNKGLNINDDDSTNRALFYIGYDKLKIYMRHFQGQDNVFKKDSSFEDIVRLYDYDKDLRIICLDALDKIEIALRARIVNIIGSEGEPHCCYEEKYFNPPKKREEGATTKIKIPAVKWEHLSIEHYHKKYKEPFLPPIWCLGDISKIYASLKINYRKEIAADFKLPESLLVSWFTTLSTLRNICVHHGSLFNMNLAVNAPKPHKKKYAEHFPFIRNQDSPNFLNIKSCYARLVIVKILLDAIDPIFSQKWKVILINHLNTRPSLLSEMGFPTGWAHFKLWTIPT
jgi:abortive infection bacteriophage resistance protein